MGTPDEPASFVDGDSYSNLPHESQQLISALSHFVATLVRPAARRAPVESQSQGVLPFR